MSDNFLFHQYILQVTIYSIHKMSHRGRYLTILLNQSSYLFRAGLHQVRGQYSLLQDLTSVGLRFELFLTKEPWLNSDNTDEGSRLVACYTLTHPNYRYTSERPAQLTRNTPHTDMQDQCDSFDEEGKILK